MTRLRLLVLAVLFLAPPVFLMALGVSTLWNSGYAFTAWWPMALCWALGYLLLHRWTRRREALLPPPSSPPPGYFTDWDRAAWEVVEAEAKASEALAPEQLTNPDHYAELSLELLRKIAAIYNPGSSNPIGHLTVPELLACVELAAADLNAKVQRYIPGSHLWRIEDYRNAQRAMGWYQAARDAYWLGAGLWNPLQAGLQYTATRFGLGSLFRKVQGNVLAWVHAAFIYELGRYLIELNSGRLKVGVARYRELLAEHALPTGGGAPPTPPLTPPPEVSGEPAGNEGVTPAAASGPSPPHSSPSVVASGPSPAASVAPIRVAVIGPVKAGKSSLINALIGQAQAVVDALPVEHQEASYRLRLGDGVSLELRDTRGYGADGPTDADLDEAIAAARDADLILLVVPARSAARAADVALLDRLREWFVTHPHLRPPPVVVAVNQVDQLSPVREWQPPYDWREGPRAKEASIRDCVASVREVFGSRVAEVVPVCTLPGASGALVDDLAAALALQLPSAQGAALLKRLALEAKAERFRKLGQQLLDGGREALKILWESLKKA